MRLVRAWLPLGLIIAVPLILTVVWLIRFRSGYLTEWDESGYLAIAFRNINALMNGGPVDLAREFEGQAPEAPLVPLLAVPVLAVFGKSVLAGLLTIPLFWVGLMVAVFGVARRLVPPNWALLAAGCVGTLPAVTDYSRIYHFALPAAAFLTAAVWALMRSDGLTDRRFALVFGAFTGMMMLSRTMTIAYVPGLGLAALAQLPRPPRLPRARAVNLALAGGAALLVAGPWYVRNWRSVSDYLVGSGFGAQSRTYGAAHSILSWGYWAKEIRLVLDQVYLPLAVGLTTCLVLGLLYWLARRGWRRAHVRTWLGADVFVLAVIVAEGYLALTSSKNEGTAFALPWLPCLVVLAIVAASRISTRSVRLALGLGLALVSVGNVLMKSGWIEPLARSRTVAIQTLGSVPVTDGRGIIQLEVAGAGYDPGSPTSPLPKLHRRWLPFSRKVTGWLIAYAGRYGQRPYAVFGSGHALFNETRIALAQALWFDRHLVTTGFIGYSPSGESVEEYRRRLLQMRNNLLETADPGPEPRKLSRVKVETAARSLGFRRVKSFTMPDGERIWWWWHSRPDLTQTRT